MMQKIKDFFIHGIWNESANRPKSLQKILHPVRFAILVFQAYLRDHSNLHASALTYITMLAIVPVLALGLSSLKAFGANETAREKIMSGIDTFATQMEQAASSKSTTSADEQIDSDEAQKALARQMRTICNQVFTQIDGINFARIGGIGAVSLIIMVLSVVGNIESSFNRIWGVKRDRPFWRKFTDYLSVLIVIPMLIIALTSVPVLDMVSRFNLEAGAAARTIADSSFMGDIMPFVIGTLIFAFLFGFLPNTKIKVSSCFLGAFLTTLFISIWFKICIGAQIGIANNSALYGSFIALPILLFWINTSWQIILFGAEICYVHQHCDELLRASSFSELTVRDRILLGIALCFETARSIRETNRPLDLTAFCQEFRLPEREKNLIFDTLLRHHILLPLADSENTENGIVLSCCATKLKIVDIIKAFTDDSAENLGIFKSKLNENPLVKKVSERFDFAMVRSFSATVADFINEPVKGGK